MSATYRELSWGRRAMMVGATIAGNVAFALSYRAVGEAETQLAAAICVAAALSWFALGAAIALLTRENRDVLAWADLCIRTMFLGTVVMLVAAAFNAVRWAAGFRPPGMGWGETLFVPLFVADVLMLARFLRGGWVLGRRGGTSGGAGGLMLAAAYWVLVLHGVFVLCLVIFAYLR